jgi:DNA-binding MarR family transcriptional regulator
MVNGLLTPHEQAVWHAFKVLGDTVMGSIERELGAVGASGADFGILSRLVDLGGGSLRQQALATSLGWNKSRLSHQLTRMEGRGLVERTVIGATTTVVITSPGRDLLARLRPVHAAAVRRELLGRLTADQQRALLASAP